MPVTNVYIDGFNFYYGAVRHTPYKWLNFAQLCRLLLPPAQFQINQIKYFTARVQGRVSDPDQPARQEIYLRALRTIPNLSIIFGHFLTNECSMMVAGQNPLTPTYVRVLKTEEKGSDVNLATHLVSDAYKGDFEVAAVISNDSDLVEPVRIVTQELGLQVGILNPHQRRSRELSQYATFYKKIRPALSQLVSSLQTWPMRRALSTSLSFGKRDFRIRTGFCGKTHAPRPTSWLRYVLL